MNLSLLFTLEPVARGFAAMALSGAFFPLCGVMVLRLDLINLRYMLMHGVILGGALALAMNLPEIPVTCAVNLLLVLLMLFLSSNGRSDSSGTTEKMGGAAAATMVLTMALASLVMHIASVPAKDTLGILWGSPFALKKTDLAAVAFLAALIVLYLVLNYRNIMCLFFNREVALSLGVNVTFHYTFMVLVIALVVAVAMKLLGAFLIDALLILPVLAAQTLCGTKNGGMKKLFILSSILGFIFAVIGYIVAVAVNWPPAATISLAAGGTFIISTAAKKISVKKTKSNKSNKN